MHLHRRLSSNTNANKDCLAWRLIFCSKLYLNYPAKSGTKSLQTCTYSVICICMAEVMCMCPRRAGIIPWPKSQCLSMPQSVVVLPLLLHRQIEMCFKILIQKGLHNAVNSPRTEISVIIYLQ